MCDLILKIRTYLVLFIPRIHLRVLPLPQISRAGAEPPSQTENVTVAAIPLRGVPMALVIVSDFGMMNSPHYHCDHRG